MILVSFIVFRPALEGQLVPVPFQLLLIIGFEISVRLS